MPVLHEYALKETATKFAADCVAQHCTEARALLLWEDDGGMEYLFWNPDSGEVRYHDLRWL